MTQAFRFTGQTPLIFHNLSYGEDTAVVRAFAPDDDQVNPIHSQAQPGATVVLYPGDVLLVADTHPVLLSLPEDPEAVPTFHSALEPCDVPNAVEAPPLKVGELRDALDAAGVEFDPKASKADLLALYEALPDEGSDENGSESGPASADAEETDEGGHSGPDGLLDPQTGADGSEAEGSDETDDDTTGKD